jgi:hypothetical protein
VASFLPAREQRSLNVNIPMPWLFVSAFRGLPKG